MVSVIIVNRNGMEFVDACLRSVLNSAYTDFEVIFVDNASTDGSREHVQKAFSQEPRLRVVVNEGSLGPAVGRNRGIAAAGGRYIAFLDNDTEVDPSWLRELAAVLDADPSIGAAQSKLLKIGERDVFDYAGDFLTSLGFLSERARGAKDTGQFDRVSDIFSAKSAASIIRRDVLDKVGGFDEDFYMYLEETDLCWRVWLAGLRVVFVPGSRVYHAYGTKKKAREEYYPPYVVRYYGCRNYITTLIKNLGTKNLAKVLPLHVFSWGALSLMFLFKGKLKDAFWLAKAIAWNVLNLACVLKKRGVIQGRVRRAADREIFSRVMAHQTPSYYLGKAFSYIYGRGY